MPIVKKDDRSLYLKRGSGDPRKWRPVVNTRFQAGDKVSTRGMTNCIPETIKVGGDENPEYWIVDISNRDFDKAKEQALEYQHNLYFPQWATIKKKINTF